MKRAVVSGIALASLLGFTAGATASEPAPPSTEVVQQVGRFQQRSVPRQAAMTGNFNRDNREAFVNATVVLVGDSVVEAKTRAQRLNRGFDARGAERQVRAQQTVAVGQLQAVGATAIGSVHQVLNAITVRVQVKNLNALTQIAGVSQVHVSSKVYRANGAADVYTGVNSVWDDFGYTGAGMTIGVIDDGIDYYHATFGGSGDPADYAADNGTAIEPGTFPTDKVLGGYDFVGDEYDAGSDDPSLLIPSPDDDPLACGVHGTHVSGTAAGIGVLADGSAYTGTYDVDTIADNDWLVAPGAAPEASIRMYKVFGCDGSVDDFVLLDAIDMAVTDGVDVINMSLGSSWGTADDPIALAIDNATAAGVLSVVSAGNDGPVPYQVGGPSTANTALSVAAVDASSDTLPGVAITGDVTLAAQNSNAYDFDANGSVTGVLVNVGLGCNLADYTPAIGKIAVATRGDCDRVVRAINAADAGALAVIFVNNADGFPPVEGVIAGGDVPFVGVPSSNGALFTNGKTITIDGSDPIPNPAYGSFASFTSNGPRQGDSAPKPDISAPGVNILSASVGTGTEGLLLSGTSMAAPHTAGIALLVRQAHPTWGPLAVKAALMGTADPEGVADYNPERGGAGMVDAPAAAATQTFLSTVDGRQNLAFGFRHLTGTFTASRSITINNTTNSPITYNMDDEVDDLGVSLTIGFSPKNVTVAANSKRTVSVTLKITDPQDLPEADADNGALALMQGLVYAIPTSITAESPVLSAPLVLVPYGVSDIRAVGTGTGKQVTGPSQLVTSIKLANHGVHFGYYDTYQWAITDKAGDNPLPSVPDVRDVGVQQFPTDEDGDLVVFTISTNDRITTQVTGEYDVYIDVDQDDEPDYVLVGIDNGLFTSGSPDGVMTAFLLDLSTSKIVDVWDAYAPNNGSIVQLPFLLAKVESESSSSLWSFLVEAYTVVADADADYTAVGSYDPSSPAVSNGDYDQLDPGQTISLPVDVDAAEAVTQGALGWLVVSVDDSAGSREADRVPLRAKPRGRG
jgi:minor extracellular serine protease Vpr